MSTTNPYSYTDNAGLIGTNNSASNAAFAAPQQTPPAGEKSWWKDATYASAISSSIKGIFDYMNMQEGYSQQKKMQESSFDFQRGMTNDIVKRGSAMPTLKRVTRKQGV